MTSDREPRQLPDVNTLIAAVWPEWLKQRVQGYRQVTDAMLLATAFHNGGTLVTLDGGLLALLPEAYRARVRVIVPEVR